MKKLQKNVFDLARQTGLDVDEVLLILWDNNFPSINDPSDKLVGSELRRAERALSIPGKRELTSPVYWQTMLSIDEKQFRALLVDMKIAMSKQARKLPRGAIKKLRRLLPKSDRPLPHLSSPETKHATITNFAWTPIGQIRNLRLLKIEEVIAIHNVLVDDFARQDDPISPSGPRSNDIISSAVFRQHTSLGSDLKYPTVEMCASALLHSLVLDHPFYNGNKRTALVCMLVLLDENELILTCEDDDLFRLVLKVAQHKIIDNQQGNLSDREVLWIAKWLKENSRSVSRGDRPLTFKKLQHILNRYGCSYNHSKSGSNLKISRKIEKHGLLGRSKELITNISYGGDGREISKATIAKVRNDLQLSEKHGFDSVAFYEDIPCSASEFIVKYRKILSRLSKM